MFSGRHRVVSAAGAVSIRLLNESERKTAMVSLYKRGNKFWVSYWR